MPWAETDHPFKDPRAIFAHPADRARRGAATVGPSCLLRSRSRVPRREDASLVAV